MTPRHEQAIVEVEARLQHELERITSDSDQQRLAITRLRSELEQAAESSVSAATAELEAHAGERRRALRELAERLQRREQELAARIESEESEALRRIQSSFGDVERRQIEQLSRVVERASERFLEMASQQFDATARSAREDAAQRLSRELDRAVQAFSRDSKTSLAEEFARVSGPARSGASGASRRSRPVSSATATSCSRPSSSALRRSSTSSGQAAVDRSGRGEPTAPCSRSGSSPGPPDRRGRCGGRGPSKGLTVLSKLRGEGFVSETTNEHGVG